MNPIVIDQATAFLLDRFGPSVAGVEPIGRGEWSRAFAFSADGNDLVARFGDHVEDFRKDELAARFRSPNLPIPRILEIGEALGGWYAVSERARGRFLDGLSVPELRATLPLLFATLDAMRSADLFTTTGFGFWGVDGNGVFPSWREALLGVAVEWSGSRLGDWRRDLIASPTGIELFDEAAERLRELVERCPEDRYLVHGDLLHFNVLIDGDKVSAVVDWGCAMYGDFLYDLAWLAFWSPWQPISAETDAPIPGEPTWDAIDWVAEASDHYDRVGLDVPHLVERLRAYQLHIGLDSMRYNAVKGRWDNLARVTAQSLALARADP